MNGKQVPPYEKLSVKMSFLTFAILATAEKISKEKYV